MSYNEKVLSCTEDSQILLGKPICHTQYGHNTARFKGVIKKAT